MVMPFLTLRFARRVNFALLAVFLALLQACLPQVSVTVASWVTPVTFSDDTRPRFQRSTAVPSTTGGGSSAIFTCTGPPAGAFLPAVPPTCTASHWPGVTIPEADCAKLALPS